MTYRVVKYKETYHVIPDHDCREHVATMPCWCQPTIDPECNAQIIHNPFLPDAEGVGEEPLDGIYH